MNSPYSLQDVDTKSSAALLCYVAEIFHELFPEASLSRLNKLFQSIESLYNGEHSSYLANDTAYHDLEHTLQVTLCWTRIFKGYTEEKKTGINSPELFECGIAAALFHDSGYLKKEEEENTHGTGARFTLIHEARSCEIASNILSELRWKENEIGTIQRLISATGPKAVIIAIPFQSEIELTLAKMLATADFLAQISDPDYVLKLPKLFEEFEENDKTRGLSSDDRNYPDLKALVNQTPNFWRKFVLPRFDKDYDGLFRFLASPYPNGDNVYINQAEANVTAVKKHPLYSS